MKPTKGKIPAFMMAKMSSKMGMSKNKPMMDDEEAEGELAVIPMKSKSKRAMSKAHKMPNGKMMKDSEMSKKK